MMNQNYIFKKINFNYWTELLENLTNLYQFRSQLSSSRDNSSPELSQWWTRITFKKKLISTIEPNYLKI